MPPKKQRPLALRTFGFSLVEILMVVAILSTITAGAVITLTNVSRAAESTKLQRDVKVINDAIRTYRLNGGSFQTADLNNPATLLAKLKKRATQESAKQLAGLRHSFADNRLSFEMQTLAEARSGRERARFIADPANPRFAIETSGPPGIRRFVLDASLAARDYGEEVRESTMKLAKKEPWVWDYHDSGGGRAAPAQPPASNPAALAVTPPDASNQTLSPPLFSLASGTYPLLTYPRSLTLSSINQAGSSQIFYSVNGGAFAPYAGPFNVHPGQTVTGICVSLNPDRYDDSATSSQNYQTTPLTPVPLLLFSKNSYDYFELGGLPHPRSPEPGARSTVTGTGLFFNALLLPISYHNSGIFRFVWTFDGTNPLISSTALRQPDFAIPFPSATINLPISSFGTASSITLRAAIRAENLAIVNNSAIVSRTFDIAKLLLRRPQITTNARDLTLNVDLSQNDIPENARIYFTTDGTDPGVSAAGDPLRGTQYLGTPIALDGYTGQVIEIRARTYPPQAYRQFFNASELSSQSYTLPASSDVYVGGNFTSPSGRPMRNIARLASGGQIDFRFDTGDGASADSLVGIVRQSAAGLIVGGDFESMNGSPIQGVVRLNNNGSVDTAFDAKLTAN